MRFVLMSLPVAALLAGCAGFGVQDTLDEVPTLDTVDVGEDGVAIAAPDDAPGFFAGLFGGAADSAPAEEAEAPSPGLLGRLMGNEAPGDVADAPEDNIPPLTNQVFGEVGTTCGLSTREMGAKIASVSGYTIYDTAPNTTAPRPYYITGFNDRCARQFTAALVLTGDVGTHEVVRYETAQSRRPYTQVDNAYEAIKASFCRAGFGKPCGRRIDALARNTTFITGYERFTSSPVWMEILLHDGEVAAVGIERK